MALAFPANGTLVLTASQQDLFAQVSGQKLYAVMVHLDTMIAGDTVEIRIFVHDQADTIERQFQLSTFNAVQTSPSQYFDFVATQKYRVSIVQTVGAFRTISWERIEVN